MSIPILVVMMLLTFRSYGEIPDRMTVFYRQAFDTLYSIHDAEGKESYKRIHDSGLPPDLFRGVLNAFCYTSLCQYEIEFTRDSLEYYVKKGIDITRTNCDVSKFISDLIKNVCILQPDGLNYLFVHRSFQEFFAATFVSRYSGKKPFAAYEQLIRVSGPDVHRMLLEIDRPKVYRKWLLPKLEKYREKIASQTNGAPYEKFQLLFDRLLVSIKDFKLQYFSSRNELSSDAAKLSYMIDPNISINYFSRNLEFSSEDKLLFKDIWDNNISELKESNLNNNKKNKNGRKSIYLTRFVVEINDDIRGILSRSNIDVLYNKYLNIIDKELKNVRSKVEKDVVVEDLIFDDI